MHENKKTNAAKTIGSLHRLPGSNHRGRLCCSASAPGCGRQENRDGSAGRSGSFTFIEIIIVVAIIAISAMLVIPMMSSAGSMQIRTAANMIAADLEYAKSMAISRGQNYSVVFDKTAESYRIENQDGEVIPHPVKKGFDYIVNFSTDSRVDKVDISDAVFDTESTITFDSLGSPYSGTGLGSPLNSGVITLQADGAIAAVNVEPVTGFISISY